MEYAKLSPRLMAIADMVPQGAKLLDVGTDHGWVPIRLLQEGRIVSAVASDIRSGPLSRAKANAAACAVKGIRFVLCDGLSGISPEETDTIVIAGMGGETIASILKAAPWSHKDRTLLLQPMSRPEILRRALENMELAIREERLVEDAGKLYSVLKATPGTPKKLDEAEYYIGAYALVSEQLLFDRMISEWIKKTETALEGLSRSQRPEDDGRREHLSVVHEQLLKIKERKWTDADGG